MKPNITLASALLLAIVASSAHAAINVITPYSNPLNTGPMTNPGPDGVDFLYDAKGTATDASYAEWNITTTVGAWSYKDLRLSANPNRGWGHTAGWYLFEVQVATQFIVTIESPDAYALPGFVIYAGESLNDDRGSAHTFSNNGLDLFTLNDPWDDNGAAKITPSGSNTNDPGLTYVNHGYNPSGNSLLKGMFLQPGLYTIAVGNAANSSATPADPTFNITFAVPEPSTALLALGGGLLAFRRRRR
ncbi:MAG: PEP-CTERM sorting domain-containing protein [Akkermansiaceae bacterium]|jgi:hypothetical protein|nr:PEP-CTERM sorting domain-containing protein [Akkermansiaceae bacterium]